MANEQQQGFRFWSVQVPGWLLLLYLVVAQGIAALDYGLGVAMGTQESADTITDVGTAFWYGFAFGDLLVYIPLLLVGLVGHLRAARWGRAMLAAALGVTIYWPVVCLAAVVRARDAAGWDLPGEAAYWAVLPPIALWGLWGLFVIVRATPPGE
jgi:hypothetical protein